MGVDWAPIVAFYSGASPWVIVAALGIVAGTADIVSRFRDAPLRALLTRSALLYMGINAVASVLALVAARALKWVERSDAANPEAYWLQILLVGLGAMAILRSSFTLRAGVHELTLGFSPILDIFLRAVNSAVDRERGRARDRVVRNVMQGITYDDACRILPAYCIALMQSLPQPDIDQLNGDIASLAGTQFTDAAKARLLGLAIMNVMGEGILAAGVESIRQDQAPQGPPASPQPPGRGASVWWNPRGRR